MEQIFSMHVSQNKFLSFKERKTKRNVFESYCILWYFSEISLFKNLKNNVRLESKANEYGLYSLYTKNYFSSTWSSKETPWYSFQNNLNSPCFQNFMDVWKKFELSWLNKWEGLNKYFVRKQCLKHPLW